MEDFNKISKVDNQSDVQNEIFETTVDLIERTFNKWNDIMKSFQRIENLLNTNNILIEIVEKVILHIL